jgi:hypothetical protein
VLFRSLATYHLVLLCTLLCIAMIEWDGNRVPAGVWIPAVAVRLVIFLAWPEFPAWEPSWLNALDRAVTRSQLAVNAPPILALALVVWWAFDRRHRLGATAAAVCIGLFLGWLAFAVLVPLAAVVFLAVARGLALRWPGLHRIPLSGALWLAAVGWIIIAGIV